VIFEQRGGRFIPQDLVATATNVGGSRYCSAVQLGPPFRESSVRQMIPRVSPNTIYCWGKTDGTSKGGVEH